MKRFIIPNDISVFWSSVRIIESISKQLDQYQIELYRMNQDLKNRIELWGTWQYPALVCMYYMCGSTKVTQNLT